MRNIITGLLLLLMSAVGVCLTRWQRVKCLRDEPFLNIQRR